MGEYATHAGQSVKIGTCEDMYYLRYDQRHQVTPERGSVDPVADAGVLRFRFPWPDEDHCEPGSAFNGQFERGVIVPGYAPPADAEHYAGHAHTHVKLTAQRYRPGIGLVPVLRCECGAMWREEERREIDALAVTFRAEADRLAAAAAFYHAVADRVLAGLDPEVDAIGAFETAAVLDEAAKEA
jgi:hypothetical protein